MHTSLFSRFSFTKSVISTCAIILFLLFLSLSNNPDILFASSTFISPILAIFCAILTIAIWKILRDRDQAREILYGFSLVFALWAFAEVIWMVFVLLGIAPYPSIADIFWIVGYFPLIYALTLNARFLKVKMGERQNLILFLIMLAGSVFTFIFVFVPILFDFSFDRILEGMINLAYPGLDLALLYYTIRLTIIVRKSNLMVAWQIIALGLSVTVVADLAYSFASWNDLYSPEHANLLSKLIDWGYMASYPIFMLGIYSYNLGYQKVQTPPEELPAEPTSQSLLTNTTFLIYTDQRDEVIDFSENLLLLNRSLSKKSFVDFLIDLTGTELESQKLRRDIQQAVELKGWIKDLRVPIQMSSGEMQDAWLSGAGIRSPENEIVGMNIILLTYLPGAIPNQGLRQSDLGVARFIRNLCGIEEYPIEQQWVAYSELMVKRLYQLQVQEMGEVVAQKMIATLNQTSKRENWGLSFDGERIQILPQLEQKMLPKRTLATEHPGKEIAAKLWWEPRAF